jgi:hypothetical protein
VNLVEEAVALLRRAPASAWAVYLAGALPYGVGLIWFWLETTHSAYARQNIGFTSGALALLFVWKQICEAVFLARLRVLLGGKAVSVQPSTILRQIAVQPTAFLAIPLAIAAMFPLPNVLMFYRQFSLAAMDGDASTIRRSLATSGFGVHSLWMLTGVASLGALLLYVNLLVAVVFLAQLATSVFGVESFDIGVVALLRNTTVHFTIGVVVYLALDLLLDAAAALQEFRAVSVRSGEDILSALALVVLLFVGMPAFAQDSQALDNAIDRTLQQPEFAWRLEPAAGDLPPLVTSLLDGPRVVARAIEDVVKAVMKWLEPKRSKAEDKPTGKSPQRVGYWLAFLALLTAAALAMFIVRIRRPKRVAKQNEPAAPVVDVRDESVLASSLAEDEWLRLAERYLSEGEPRLALRALHLACLRLLSERGLIAVTRSKTGAEYLAEVRRRSRQTPPLAVQFRESVEIFELGWYSSHPVNREMLDTYREGLEEIRGYAH